MQAKISLLIDYAHEPESLSLFLQTLRDWKKVGYFDVLVHVLSCDGVGRDDWKKPIMGQLSYKYADFTILTTDNYGPLDDPHAILALLGKNFLHKNEQLTQEWLDNLIHKPTSLSADSCGETEKITDFSGYVFEKPKVKFLLEINRRKALAKALKVGLFLAQNYDFLNLKYTPELPSLPKNPQKLNSSYASNNLKAPNLTQKSKELGQPLRQDFEQSSQLEQQFPSQTQNDFLSDQLGESILTKQSKSSLGSEPTEIKLEMDVLAQILADDYGDEKLESFSDLMVENNLETWNDKVAKKSDNLEKIDLSSQEFLDESQKPSSVLNSSPKNLDLDQKSDLKKQTLDTANPVKVLIFSTGVGCEPFLSQPNGPLSWNERQIWQELWQEFINVEMFNQKLAQKFAQAALD